MFCSASIALLQSCRRDGLGRPSWRRIVMVASRAVSHGPPLKLLKMQVRVPGSLWLGLSSLYVSPCSMCCLRFMFSLLHMFVSLSRVRASVLPFSACVRLCTRCPLRPLTRYGPQWTPGALAVFSR